MCTIDEVNNSLQGWLSCKLLIIYFIIILCTCIHIPQIFLQNHISSGCHGALNQKSHLCAILWFLADIPFKESEVEPGGVYINQIRLQWWQDFTQWLTFPPHNGGNQACFRKNFPSSDK